MPSTLSPNMSLILPTVGQEPGPNWALDLNNSLSIIDQHNHAPGNGAPITSASLDINIDLPFNNNNATDLRSIRFQPNLSPLSTGLDIGCVYVSGQDLYYNDTLGNQIQLTAAGAVNGTPGSIGNLIAPAAVTYVPATQTFVFESNQGSATPASLDGGNLYLRNISPSSNYVQLQPNAVLPASYSLTLPSALPASSKIMRLDNLGNISANLDVDNSTLEISSNNLQVKDGGITSAKIASGAVTPDKIGSLTFSQILDQAGSGGVSALPIAGVPIDETYPNVGGRRNAAILFTFSFTSPAPNTKFLLNFYTRNVSPNFYAWGMGIQFNELLCSLGVAAEGPGFSNNLIFTSSVVGANFSLSSWRAPFTSSLIFNAPQAGVYTLRAIAYAYYNTTTYTFAGMCMQAQQML